MRWLDHRARGQRLDLVVAELNCLTREELFQVVAQLPVRAVDFGPGLALQGTIDRTAFGCLESCGRM